MATTVNKPVFILESPRRLPPGTVMAVQLDLIAGPYYNPRPGPHGVGRAEVMDDGRLAVWLTEASHAGRDARALISDDMVDVSVEGEPPVVWLRP